MASLFMFTHASKTFCVYISCNITKFKLVIPNIIYYDWVFKIIMFLSYCGKRGGAESLGNGVRSVANVLQC